MSSSPHELNERIRVVTGYDQASMAVDLGQLTKEREDARAELDYLKEMRKVMLSAAAMDWSAEQFKTTGKLPPISLCEHHGRKSEAYRIQIDAIKAAHKTWGALFSKTKRIEAEQMAATMQISFYKAELNHR